MIKHQAQAALLAVTFLALVATVSLVGARVIVNEVRHTGKIEDTITAFFAAEAGIEDGLVRLKFNPRFADSYDQTNKFCALINLDNNDTSLACDQENDSAYFNNRLYRLKIWQETGNIIETGKVTKDQILEYPLTADVLGDPITITWTNNPKRDDLLPGDDLVRAFIEARVYNAHAGLHNQFVRQEINRVGDKPDICAREVNIPTLPSEIGDSTPDLRLRIRPYFVYKKADSCLQDITKQVGDDYYIPEPGLSISAGSIPLNKGEAMIESTGFYGGTQRTLKATLDTTTGQVVSLLDFAVYAGEGDVTK